MTNLVNIIHPYTYKIKDKTNIVGPIEEFQERDEKVGTFVSAALDNRAKVLHHRDTPEDTLNGAMRDVAFSFDPIYEFLFDKRIVAFTTTIYGTPILDEKPKEIKEEWTKLTRIFVSHSALQKIIGNSLNVLFIGGVFECCMANAMAYFHRHYRKNGETLFYVPELCVSFNAAKKLEIERKLSEYNINPLNFEESLHLLSL